MFISIFGSGITSGITGPKPQGNWLPCEVCGEAPVHAVVRRRLVTTGFNSELSVWSLFDLYPIAHHPKLYLF